MQKRPQSFDECRWASHRLSLRLDAELSELEAARLDAHLAACEACREASARLHGMTAALRTAPLEQPETPFVLPRRRSFGTYAFRAASAGAAVVVFTVSGLVGISGLARPNLAQTPSPTVNARVGRDRMAVKNRLLNQLDSAHLRAVPKVRPSVAAAEEVNAGATAASLSTGQISNEGR